MRCGYCKIEFPVYSQKKKRFCSGVCRNKGYKRRQRESSKQKLHELKEVHPCADCGNTFPSYCMDFDHKNNATKLDNVSFMISRFSWSRIEKEIAKCDLVCANCHRIRTHAEPKTFPQNPDRKLRQNRKRF
jgi:hypothetical protein